MKSLSRRLIKKRACAMLVTLLCESAKTVLKMNSLILFLFLGATVALAEIHVENDPHHKPHCPFKKCLKICLHPSNPPKRSGEIADEENDPHRHPRPSGPRPSLPPAVKKCVKECCERHKPTRPGKESDEENDPRRPRPSGCPPRPSRPSRPRPSRPSRPRPSRPSGKRTPTPP